MQTAAALWLVAVVWLNCAGWTLAALHQLNPAGYAVALLPGVFLAFRWLKQNPPAFRPQIFFRRFRRPLPGTFLLLATLVFLGGILYAPNNYDALTYRLPRMLNWFAAGKWFWIPTVNDRMNCANTAWEWTALPLLALTRSDRGLFLINALGFLLLPGLLFSVFRQLGVARKVAWTWMWLLPLGYGFVTQAGSIGNDLMGAVCCLLSVHFGLRARHSGRVSEVWFALLAAALMTGVKISNAPLLLPCLLAVWPVLGRLRNHLAGGVAVAGVAVLISAAPTMVLNQLHTGSWSGDPQDKYQMQIKNPVAAVLGNSILLAEQSLAPPVLLHSREINNWLMRRLPDLLRTKFPRLALSNFNELPAEEGAALGLGVSLPLLLVVIVALCGFSRAGLMKKLRSLLPPVVFGAWIAAFFFMAKLGSEAGSRLMLPYYPLAIIPFLLLSAQVRLLRRRSWRAFLVLLALGALPVVILSVARPLWPAQTVAGWLVRTHPDSKLLQRMLTSYTTYAQRNDFLAPIRSAVPAAVREIGFIAGLNDSSYPLWRPLGQREVTDLGYDMPRSLDDAGAIEWVVVKENFWAEACAVPLKTWAATHRAEIVRSLPVVESVTLGPEDWCVLHLHHSEAQNSSAAR